MLRAILSSIFADIVALYFCSLFLYNSDRLFCPYLVLDIAVVLHALSGVALAWGGGGGGEGWGGAGATFCGQSHGALIHYVTS